MSTTTTSTTTRTTVSSSSEPIQKPRRGRPPKKNLDASVTPVSKPAKRNKPNDTTKKTVTFQLPDERGAEPPTPSPTPTTTSTRYDAASSSSSSSSSSSLNKAKRTAEQQRAVMHFFTTLNRRQHLETLAGMWIRRVASASSTWEEAVCTILSKFCNNKIFSLSCHRYVMYFFNECEDALQNRETAERLNEIDPFWITLSDLATYTPDLAKAWLALIENFSMWTQYTVQNKMLSLTCFKHNALFDMETMSSTVAACLRRLIVNELGSLEALKGYDEIEQRYANQSPFARRVLARRSLDEIFSNTPLF